MRLIKVLLIGLAISCIFGANSYSQDASIVIRNVSVIPMTSPYIMPNRDVWIENGRIKWIVTNGSLEIGKDVRVVEGQDRYLMPGLSEMHAHIPVPEDGDETWVKDAMMLYLANGVTVIRGMLGNPYHLEFRKKVERGEILAPRVYTSSPSMNGRSVSTVEEARSKVVQAKEDGYDFLKIHPGIKLEVMQVLVETAKNVGIGYAGHVPLDVGVKNAIEFGYQSIDHADGYIEGLLKESSEMTTEQGGFFGFNLVDDLDWSGMNNLAMMTVEKGVWIVPTQSLFTRWISPEPAEEMMQAEEMSYLPASMRYAWTTNKSRMINDPSYSKDKFEKFIETRNRILKSLVDHGVRFLLGSDSPQVMNVPGFSIHHEIDALVDAGIYVYDILESGTSNVARFFNESGEYGNVVEGASADLILLDGNPLTDRAVLCRPRAVFIRGKWLSRDFLDKELEKIANRYKGE